MLLDAPSLYFRAFFGVPQTAVAADGMPVNALKGLLDFIAHLLTVRRPTHLGGVHGRRLASSVARCRGAVV